MLLRKPLIEGNKTAHIITDEISRPTETLPSKNWWKCFGITTTFLFLGLVIGGGYTVTTGIGVWGLNRTVGWSFDITNFVFWIGIGHAGTLISAILLLFRQKWRTSINRAAEAMTLFAVMCAGLFPILHMGRPWLAYWLFPYPNTRGPLWVNFRSPLVWDVFAISTYLTISAVFWYIGLLPDLATLRDRSQNKIRKFIYGALSFGWDGSQRTWARYEILCLILAGLATPLVLSVHTIVSFDFATSVLPGWHTTIFPPYFVAGAIFSGFAMVLFLLILTRTALSIKEYITMGHLEAMCKIILLTGSMVGLAYMIEFFTAWYSGNPYEIFTFMNRAKGPYAWAYWTMFSCNAFIPQLFWFKKIRTSIPAMFIISMLVNLGMWMERFVLITTSLHRDFLPSSWSMYFPTIVEIGIMLGSFGLFFTLYLVCIRVLPVIAMSEVKGVLK